MKLKILAIGVLLASSLFTVSEASASTSDCTIENNTKCTVSFAYSGAPETFTVPAGVTSIYFDVRGAQGGGTSGGQGGIDTGTLMVTSGINLIVRVGGQGSLGLSAAGGFNGGGATSAGDTAPGSGGGASDIRLSVDTLSARVIVAGGGGGQSTYCGVISIPTANVGGAGGAETGGNGGSAATNCWAGSYGGGGTQTSGGIKGGTTSYLNTAGTLGQGGNGKGYSAGGGGGGGGYYGGGGAAVGAGGGGSSFIDTSTSRSAYVVNGVLTRGGRTGNGIISLTYTIPIPANVNLSVPSFTTFRTSSDLTVSSDTPGKITFYANGKRIPRCIAIPLSGISPTFSATCAYKPSSRGIVSLTATITPSDSRLQSSSIPISVSSKPRSGNR